MTAASSAEPSTAASPKHGGNPTVVRADALTKVFDGGVTAVDSANFEIERGEFISIVGPSGCGKSTLLRLIAGLLPYTSGNLHVHDQRVTAPRDDVGMMFQKATLLEWKTAFENVLLPMQLRGQVTEEQKTRALELLHLTGLQEFEFTFPQHLSGGMQQRVALARVLNIGAEILLLDEPFGALDEFTRERMNLELMRIVTEVRATSVFVTHNISEAIFLADRVMVMQTKPGRVAEIVTVPLARPRPIEIQETPEFNEIVGRVRTILGGA